MLEKFLLDFEKLQSRSPGPVDWSWTHDGGEHDFHILIGGLVHGDEVGSLPALIRALQEFSTGKLRYGGKFTVFLGNVPAARKGLRFLEQDLNRVFAPSAPESAEKSRAFELMPLLSKADVFLDFHQTREPCVEPFYTFGFDVDSYLWARAVGGGRVLVTRAPGVSFAGTAVCCDEYARNKGIPAMTLELGQRGFSEQSEALASYSLRKCLQLGEQLMKGRKLTQLAKQKEDFRFFTIAHRKAFSHDDMRMKQGCSNFMEVKEGELLGHNENGSEFFAPLPGVLLFPKYPDRNEKGQILGARPTEIYNLAVPLDGHPLQLYRKALPELAISRCKG
jgi:succinylglutamate desuccinylase